MKVFLKGLNSCVMRRQKLQQYRHFLTANGHKIASSPCHSDVNILWACAFRKDTLDNSIFEIKRYQHEYSGELIVAGCLPDIAPKSLQEIFLGRIINWRDDKEKMESIFGCGKFKLSKNNPVYCESKLCNDAQKYREENPDKDATFHDQFIKLVISEGCNFKCTYCSERLAFPPFHSFPEDRLVKACCQMVEKTKQYDVILLADSLGEYGIDNGSSLPKLIRKLKQAEPALSFALSNLNPTHFLQYYNDMVGFLQNGSINHLSLPIQSASNRILKLMNRTYAREDINKIFGLFNSIGFTKIDTHIVVGFPGESDSDFEETIKFILRHRPRYVLLNSFFESSEAPASKFPDKISKETKRQRIWCAETSLKAAGIICNADDSELSVNRFHRLNRV